MYNAEKYITQCLDSILAQTFKDYEVIVIDDCSTDRSVKVAESLTPKFDGRLQLIRLDKNTGGAAIPRNVGIKAARGKYITFVDSDDLLFGNALDLLSNVAEKFSADVVHSEKYCESAARDGQINSQTKLFINTIQSAPFVSKPTLETNDIGARIIRFCQRGYLWWGCNKLFRRDFIIDNQIEFVNIYAEDLLFTSFCVCCAKNYVRIPDIIYIYRFNPDSQTRSHLSLEKAVNKILPPIAESITSWNEYFDRIKLFNEHPEFKFILLNFIFQTLIINEGGIYQQIPPHLLEQLIRREFSKYDSKDSATLMTYLFNIAAVNYRQFWQLQSHTALLEHNRLKQQTAALNKSDDKILRTWDMFDTLIARRCVFPQRVFELIGRRINMQKFAEMRLKAEQLILKIGINYKLTDIYDVMHQIFRIDKKVIDHWKQVEIDIELEQAIPITENINRVQSGDVLISDACLPEDSLRRILEKCGLFVPVELIITNKNKSSDNLYQQFQNQGVYQIHTGKDKQSDVGKPHEYYFDSSWTVLGRPTPVEAQLLNVDFEFGAYLRELRLANPFEDEVKRAYWSMFVLNVGALMLIAKLIDKVQKECGFEYLGFCGRDTYYMRQIYRRLKRDRNETESVNNYFYFSRELMQNCEADMIKYFAHEIGERHSLMIDLFGTGMHLSMLRAKANLNYSILMCIFYGYNAAVNMYSTMKEYFSTDWSYVNSLNTGGGTKNSIFACSIWRRTGSRQENRLSCSIARHTTRRFV